MRARAGRVCVLVALLAAAPLLSSQAAVVAFEFTTAIDATDFGLSAAEPVALRFAYDPVRALVLQSYGDPAYFTAYGLVDGTFAIGGELLTIHGVASVFDADGLQEGFGYSVIDGNYGASVAGAIGRKPIDEIAFEFANYTEFGMFASTELPSTTDFSALANSAVLVFRDTTSGSEAVAAFLLPGQAGEFSFTAPEPVALLGGLAALGALAAASGALRGAKSRHRAPAPRRSRSRIRDRSLRIGAAAILLCAAPAAHAATLAYVVAGEATGSIDGAGFSDAPFSIALIADSSGITQDMDSAEHGIIVYLTPLTAASIAIQGVGFGLFSNPLRVFVNQTYPSAGVTREFGGDLLDMIDVAFVTVDLGSAFGPTTPTDAHPVYFAAVATSLGAITFASVSNVSFEVVPEPEAAALAAVIALALLGARRAHWRSLAAAGAVLAVASGAHATVFVVDPGAAGAAPDDVSIASPEILGVAADGQTFEWIFVFADGKFVRLGNPFEAGSKRSAALLGLGFAGESCAVPECVPFQNPIAGTQIMYLLSRDGDPISGTGVFDAGVSNGTDTAHYNVFAAGDENNPTLTYHGVYFQVTLPTVGSGGPLPVVTSATLNHSGAFANAVVPEPAAFPGVLLALGAIGVLTRRRPRRTLVRGIWIALVAFAPLRGDAAVYYLDLADTAVTQNLNLDLVPGWAPGQPWEFRIANYASIQTILLTNQSGMPEPGNRILAINVPVCPGVIAGLYQNETIPLEDDEIIGANPMPAASFTEIGVPYWSGSATLRQGSQLCTGLLGYMREPTQWEQLAPGARRYVGLLLTIEGEIHYGWLGLNVGSLLIDDFAYEDVPERPIRAGDTVPEPDALLVDLIAAGALIALRRRARRAGRAR